MAKANYLVGFIISNHLDKQQTFASKILECDIKSVPPMQLGMLIQRKPNPTEAEKIAYCKEVEKTQFLDRTLTFIMAAGFNPAKTTIQFITKID